ncbi:MAG: hypothetical protein KatS3mg109_1279 [Pirellulaceae bacterium]|nr:MAG: hypothetical protein KatS3mg109_1279 [Pirellulaceae bacterium]
MRRVRCCSFPAILVAAMGFGASLSADQRTETIWKYVPSDQIPAVTRTIELSEERPEDLIEEATYRGSARRYAQLRYGSENSRRVTIVVDELGEGRYDFYADGNRDRRITPDERLAGEGRQRTIHLAAEIIRETIIEQEPRQVLLRLGTLRNRLIVGTIGHIEGEVCVSGADASGPVARNVRRVDGNANGLFADAGDYLWIDLDGNGQWDPVGEQFAFLPVLRLFGRRFAVHSDRFGRSFALREIVGTGTLQVVVQALPASARVTLFEATIFSPDGMVFATRQVGEKLTVPVGKYALASVTLSVDDGRGVPWQFVFSRSDSVGQDRWVEVSQNQEVVLEAIGKLKFFLDFADTRQVKPGDNLVVYPRLYTENGLLINLSCRGNQLASPAQEQLHNKCSLKLIDPDGRHLSTSSSGFS